MPVDLNDISDLLDASIPGIPFRAVLRTNFRPKLWEQVDFLRDLNVAICVWVALVDTLLLLHPCATRHRVAHCLEQNL